MSWRPMTERRRDWSMAQARSTRSPSRRRRAGRTSRRWCAATASARQSISTPPITRAGCCRRSTTPTRRTCYVTGTGLTHLGIGRGARRHAQEAHADGQSLTDSMKMFRMGLEGGKPAPGQAGVQPEWFYKGNGSMRGRRRAPRCLSPAFAQGRRRRAGDRRHLRHRRPTARPAALGFALGNEFSDHVTERAELSVARPLEAARLLVRAGAARSATLPADVRGTLAHPAATARSCGRSRSCSGEANMCHTIANLEHHHFKYALFRQPGRSSTSISSAPRR